MKKFRIISLVLVFICLNFIFEPVTLTYANEDFSESKYVEDILKNIIKEYGEENIIFEDGITLKQNDSIDINAISEEGYDYFTENNEILSVGNVLTGLKEGTTFLIGKNNENMYTVREVYVYEERDVVNYATSRGLRDKYVVYIDPGHGGSDPGTRGNGIVEKDYVLDLSLRIRDRLESRGINVAMTRNTDSFVALKDITAKANAAAPDIFLSIHANSSIFTSPSGIENFYWKSIDKSLSQIVHNKLISYTGAINRGSKADDFYVVKNTNMPANLVEVGFLSNKEEANNLKNPGYQEKLINAIVDGAVKYLEENISLSGNSINSERIYGSTRYETAIKVFEKGWNSSDYAVVASGLDYADALCAAPLAKKYNAPILLSTNNNLSSQNNLLNILKNKGVKEVFIVGGTGVIPQSFEVELNNIGIASHRLGGINRYETSIEIAKALNSNSGEVALASGVDFPDGLSISTIAAQRNMPILLTEPRNLPKSVESYLSKLNINKSYIIGSEGAISREVANKTINPERIGGIDRFETNKLVYERFKSDINTEEFYLTAGYNFPDTLSSSALASKDGKFVLITNPNDSNQYTKSIINNNSNINKVYVLGSEALIPNSTLVKYGLKY